MRTSFIRIAAALALAASTTAARAETCPPDPHASKLERYLVRPIGQIVQPIGRLLVRPTKRAWGSVTQPESLGVLVVGGWDETKPSLWRDRFILAEDWARDPIVSRQKGFLVQLPPRTTDDPLVCGPRPDYVWDPVSAAYPDVPESLRFAPPRHELLFIARIRHRSPRTNTSGDPRMRVVTNIEEEFCPLGVTADLECRTPAAAPAPVEPAPPQS